MATENLIKCVGVARSFWVFSWAPVVYDHQNEKKIVFAVLVIHGGTVLVDGTCSKPMDTTVYMQVVL